MAKFKKRELAEKTDAKFADTKAALELVIGCITAKGQRKKIADDEQVKALLDFYGVDVDA